jgi:hypothetical protein
MTSRPRVDHPIDLGAAEPADRDHHADGTGRRSAPHISLIAMQDTTGTAVQLGRAARRPR